MFSVQNLLFQYGSRTIFRDFSIDIPHSSLCLAPNGSGKTTFLRLIAHILPAQAGTLTLNGQTAYRCSIFTNSGILFDDLPIQTQIRWIQAFSHQPPAWFDHNVERYQLSDWLRRTPSELSAGQKQWTALALTCMMPADIYLLDEPLNSLDDDRIHLFAAILNEDLAARKFFIITGHQNSHQILGRLAPLDTISLPPAGA